jgi:hypothetical protein
VTSLAVLVLAGAVQAPDTASASVELHGRVVCLDPANERRPCGAGPHRFALEDGDGRLTRFLEKDQLAGIFEDARVRERDLVVRARPAGKDAVEIIKVFTVKDGTLHDVHYFCDVCHIAAYVPGHCPCCGQEMELRETPLP